MDELYRQNARIVYHFLYSMCKDEVLAEDLTQETFVKAFEAIERYDGSCKVSTWLCQIAKHLLYQHWAKHKKVDFVELDEGLQAIENTENQAMYKIELDQVWYNIQRLPEQMRQVVELRVMSDLSYKMIGGMLGRNESWARVTFYRAKLILLKEVEDEENRL